MTRLERVVVVALCGALVVFGPVLDPAANLGWALPSLAFGALAVLVVVDAIVGTSRAGLRRWGRRLGRGAAVLVGLGVAGAWFFAAAQGAFVLAVYDHAAAVALVALNAVALAAVLRRPRSAARRIAWEVAAGALALAHPAVGVLAWRPPDTATCEHARRLPYVRYLTPVDWAVRGSDPYDLLWLPHRQLLVAAFKAAGNGALPWWNGEDLNKVVAFDLTGPRPRTFPPLDTHSDELAQYLAYDADTGEVLLTTLGRGHSSVCRVGLPSASAPLRLIACSPVPSETHRPFTVPHGDRVGFFTPPCSAAFVPRPPRVDRVFHHVDLCLSPYILDAWQRPGSNTVYVAPIGTAILRFDVARWTTRRFRVPFSGGMLDVDEEHARLYQTDMLFHAIHVIDLDSGQLVARRRVGYTPRPVAVDGGRDLLFVGDWFGGRVVVYHASDLGEVTAIDLGCLVRHFAYDAVGRRLFVSTKCGLAVVDVDAALAGRGAGPERQRAARGAEGTRPRRSRSCWTSSRNASSYSTSPSWRALASVWRHHAR